MYGSSMKLRKSYVEEVRKDILLYVDREVDDKCDTTDDAAKMSMEWGRRIHLSEAHVFDTLEDDMNLALKELKAVVGTTAVATSALRCVTGERT